MLREVFIPLEALVVPFAIYWVYRLILRQCRSERRGAWPVTILFLTGAVLAIETFALTALTEPRSTERIPGSTHVIEDRS